MRTYTRTTLRERFDKYAMPIPWTGCWLWTGMLAGTGYAAIRDDRDGQKQIRASHASYRLHIGEVPEDKIVLHKCDNPVCVNPEHLFLGTHLDNAKDRNAKGRQAHNWGEKNGHARLTLEQVESIRRDTRRPIRIIADEYRVSVSTVSMIKSGKRWADK